MTGGGESLLSLCLPFGQPPPSSEGGFFAGRSYASKVEAEKPAFEQRSKHQKNGHKNSATSIVAAFADMGG